MGTITITFRSSVALVTIDNPPVNALSTRSGLVDALASAIATHVSDAAVTAIVVVGAGRCFSAGADIADFGEDPAKDVGPIRNLMALLDRIDKPVVAAIHGWALGGGLEFALACHARICTEEARFAFPEVTLGLLPGGGGTQRLTRLIGPAAACGLMISGRRIAASEALRLGLVDRVASADLVGEAETLAIDLAGSPRPLPRPRDAAVAGAWDIEAARTAASARHGFGEAPRQIVACVEAACGSPFDEGLAYEYRAFDRLMLSEEARGLRHAFLSESAVSAVPGLPPPRPAARPAKAAVVGAGTMGTGIATCLLDAGFEVVLTDPNAEPLARGLAGIERNLRVAVEKGRCSIEAATERRARLVVSASLEGAATADIVIEAAFEDLEVKRRIFRQLDGIAGADAILATNTSTLDVDAIAAATDRPRSVIGLHFFSPANVMKLLEIVRGPRTDPQVVADALAFARRIGKVGVVSGLCDGFIGNRIFEEYLRQAYFLLEEGALPSRVDRAMEAWGFAMGPLRVMDLAGQDIGWNIRKRRAKEQPDRPYSRIPDMICELGRFGQKTGLGYYRYDPENRRGAPDPEIDAMIVAHSAELGVERREIGDAEIVARCVFAMVNEGARILEEKIAARPLDIDVVYLNGYGFPRFRGGPMFHADRVGLGAVLERIEHFAAGHHGWAWRPAPLLARLVKEGRSFSDLDG